MELDELPRVEGELLDLDELRRVREQSWIARSDRGFEVLSYDEGFQVLEHPMLQKGPSFTYRIEQFGLTGEAKRYFGMSVPATEGDYRKRLRAPLAAVFRPSQVAKLREAVHRIAQDAVAALPDDGPLDLMELVGWVVPSQTYCELVSIPYEQAPEIRRFGESILGAILTVDTERRSETEAAIIESVELARTHLNARRGRLGDDFTSVLIQQQERGAITEDELLVEAFSILQASVDNTAHQLGNTLGMLLEDPARWAELRDGRVTVSGAIEEAIRLAPRFATIFRYSPEDVELNGVPISAGSWVFVSVRAGQRDPAVFADPDTWDATRPTNRRLMFGAGPYNCLGQNLARMEIEEVLRALLERFPDLTLAEPWGRRETNAVSETKRLIAAAS